MTTIKENITTPNIIAISEIRLNIPFVELNESGNLIYARTIYVKIKPDITALDAVLCITPNIIYTIYQFAILGNLREQTRRFSEIDINYITWSFKNKNTTILHVEPPTKEIPSMVISGSINSPKKANDADYRDLMSWFFGNPSSEYPFDKSVPPNPQDFAAVEKEKVKTEKDIAPKQTTRERQTWFYYDKGNGMKEWYQIKKIDETTNYLRGYHNGQYKSFLKSKISNRSDDN